MFDFLASALGFFYEVWPSYGGAIILFTLAVMLVLTPLSIKSTRSMIAMQRVQPELKRLQQKHKGDREALNREMMAFYSANNINPMSSCLPLLLQMPVFLVLYRVLDGLANRSDGDGSTFAPKYLSEDSALRTALEGATEMMSFGMDLSRSALWELQNEGFVTAIPFIVLVGLVALTAYIQQRQIAVRSAATRDASTPVNAQQQMLMKVMPFIFIPISVSIDAGVVIYFVVSNLVRIGQQYLVTHLEFGNRAQARRAAADVVEASSTEKGTDGDGGTPAPKPPKPPKPSGASANGSNGSNGSGASNGAKRPASGRVTQKGTAGAGASSSRSRKRKRK